MTVLEIVAYSKDKNNIQNLKEAHLAYPLTGLQGNMAKSAIAVFMAETLIHALKHEEHDEGLYIFLEEFIKTLDGVGDNLALAPHSFLLELSRFLGFYPELPDIEALPYFDLLAGQFTNFIPHHPHYTTGDETQLLATFLTGNTQINRQGRELLLNRLTEFYQIHIEGFGSLKSHHVLKEVLG